MNDQTSPVKNADMPRNPTGTPLFATIIVAVLSLTTIMTAKDIESGKEIVISGRRAGMKRLLVALAESLGTTGSIVVGVLVTGLCVVWLITVIHKNKAMETKKP